jgi:hypothetical protein
MVFTSDAAIASTLRSLVSAQWGRVRNGRFSVSLYLSLFLQQKRRDERERYIGRSQHSTFRYLGNRSNLKRFTKLQQKKLCGNFYGYEIRALLDRKIRQKVFFEESRRQARKRW